MPYATKDTNGESLHEFGHSLKGEALLDIELRRTFGEAVHRDYRQNEKAQKMGYDYLLKWTHNNLVYMVSVDDKADDWLKKTRNVSLELFTLSPTRSISDGWLFYSQAFALRYASMGSKEVLFLPLDEVRAYVLTRLDTFETVGVVNAPRGNFTHITFNVLVPAFELLENCPSARIVMLMDAEADISDEFKDRVLTPESLLAELEGRADLGKYSKAARGLATDAIQRHIKSNRFAERQAGYVSQCRLPRGLELKTA